ncbi:MAG: hypothetical protein Q7J98_12455, partial [Kiritimatiellia bacterium]|nr:hypothetical protein [Kiritimatiellia bacterium]
MKRNGSKLTSALISLIIVLGIAGYLAAKEGADMRSKSQNPGTGGILVHGFLTMTIICAGVTPRMRTPMTYVIDYSQKYLDDDANIEAFRKAPPDLMHVGKSVPILHNWGPVSLICGENQYTGGPGHTLSWEAIRLLTPAELEQRIKRLKMYTKKWHAIGVPRLVPYSSFHTI